MHLDYPQKESCCITGCNRRVTWYRSYVSFSYKTLFCTKHARMQKDFLEPGMGWNKIPSFSKKKEKQKSLDVCP